MKIRYSDEVRAQLDPHRKVPKGRTPYDMEQVQYKGLWMQRWLRGRIIEEEEKRRG